MLRLEPWARQDSNLRPTDYEINRLNARAQHFRSERGELGDLEVPVPGVHYGVRQGDRAAAPPRSGSPAPHRPSGPASRGETPAAAPPGSCG